MDELKEYFSVVSMGLKENIQNIIQFVNDLIDEFKEILPGFMVRISGLDPSTLPEVLDNMPLEIKPILNEIDRMSKEVTTDAESHAIRPKGMLGAFTKYVSQALS